MLKEIRIKRGMSQSQLAAASGINIRKLQNYEQGFRNINGAKISVLLDLAIALNCDISDILSEEETIEKYKQFKKIKHD